MANFKAILRSVLGTSLLALTFGSIAAPVKGNPNNPPKDPPAAATYCASSASLSLTDVKFNGIAANDCYGAVNIGEQGTSNIQSFVNDIDGVGPLGGLWTPDAWTFIVRDDEAQGNSGIKSFGDYEFSIAADNSAVGGNWILTVTGTPLPFSMDFLVYLHGGNNGAFYFFNDRDIFAANQGTFSIEFENNGGNNPGLSGLTILGRDITRTEVPEPSMAALVGLALLGLGIVRRRRQT